MDTLSYARMVLWSFFGIRRRAAAGASDMPDYSILATVSIASLFLTISPPAGI